MDINEAADILEVSTNISKDELKKKFRIMVIKYHPDRNQTDTTKIFIQIKEAYETLFKYDPNPVYAQPNIINLNGVSFGNFSTTGASFTFTTGY